jgi:hypothetical protein
MIERDWGEHTESGGEESVLQTPLPSSMSILDPEGHQVPNLPSG